LPAEFRTLATNLANASRNPALQARARKLLPPVTTRANTRLADARFLARQEGDAAKGKLVFNAKTGADCASCHALAPGKSSVGPNLSDIGTKLGKEALLDAILNPSAGIAHEYVAWVLDTKTQGQVIGILAEDTPQRIVVRTETGDEIRLRPADVTARRQSKLSLMPEDLVTRMTERELIDLVEYLTTLRQPAAAAAR
jgi:putative heme-binding domain-containing protein